MFCSNCGKQIDNDAIFCSGCGARVGGNTQQNVRQSTQNNVQRNTQYGVYNRALEETPAEDENDDVIGVDMSGVLLFLMMAATVLVGLGGILPTMSMDIGWDAESFSIVNLFSYAKDLAEFSDSAWMFLVLAGISLLLYIISVIFAVRAIMAMLTGGGKLEMTDNMAMSMKLSIAHLAIPMIIGLIVNWILSEELYGMTIFKMTPLGWVVLAVALFNLFVLIRSYLHEDVLGMPSATHRAENERITAGKMCLVCKAEFTLGTICPNCGSPSVRQKG